MKKLSLTFHGDSLAEMRESMEAFLAGDDAGGNGVGTAPGAAADASATAAKPARGRGRPPKQVTDVPDPAPPGGAATAATFPEGGAAAQQGQLPGWPVQAAAPQGGQAAAQAPGGAQSANNLTQAGAAQAAVGPGIEQIRGRIGSMMQSAGGQGTTGGQVMQDQIVQVMRNMTGKATLQELAAAPPEILHRFWIGLDALQTPASNPNQPPASPFG